MSPYLVGLAIASVLVAVAERLRPRRPAQGPLRARLGVDVLFFVFNAHGLGVLLYGLSRRFLVPALDASGITATLERDVAASWPWWLQLGVLVVGFDFLQWLIHRLLHAVPWLWELHKVHHSVADGEMDWIVSFRFHWLEGALYKALLYPAMAFFGFSPTVVLAQALIGTVMGHLNHANLDFGRGPLRYVLNSPRMHLWHHDADGPPRNFGVIFSAWDWIFGTARLPEGAPEHLGFDGLERFPRGFVGQQLWPLGKRRA